MDNRADFIRREKIGTRYVRMMNHNISVTLVAIRAIAPIDNPNTSHGRCTVVRLEHVRNVTTFLI